MKLRNNRRKKQPKPSVIRPWSGVRNAVIAVLFAVNVVLLLALGCVKGYDAVLKHQMHKQMDSMLAQQGVLCGSSVYRTMEHAPQAYTLRADERVQKRCAERCCAETSRPKQRAAQWFGAVTMERYRGRSPANWMRMCSCRM